jgi:predicted permease
MFESWLSTLSAALTVFTVVSLGVAARWFGVLTKESDESLLKLVIRVMLPCLIFSVITGRQDIFVNASDLLLPPVVGFCSIALGLLLAGMFASFGPKITGLQTVEQRRTFVFTVGIFNYGYLAIPLVTMLYNESTLAVLFLHNMGVEIAFWTIGIIVITGQMDRRWWRHVINPPSITILVSLVLGTLGVTEYFPHFFNQSVKWVGDATIPVAMIIVGASIADELEASARGLHWRDGFKQLFWAVGLRLGLIPLGMLMIGWLVGPSEGLKNVISVEAAMPSAVFSIVIARHYGGDPPTAVRIVLVTSLLCLATIPLWLFVGRMILGIY